MQNSRFRLTGTWSSRGRRSSAAWSAPSPPISSTLPSRDSATRGPSASFRPTATSSSTSPAASTWTSWDGDRWRHFVTSCCYFNRIHVTTFGDLFAHLFVINYHILPWNSRMLPELYQNALTGRPSLRYSRVHRWRPRCGLHILQLEDRPAQKEAPCIVSEGSDNFDICTIV